jgi:membrane-associated phospholipid phosphatase
LKALVAKHHWLGILWLVLAGGSYFVINRLPRGELIDMSTDFDRALPTWPIFVVPYLSFLPLVFILMPLLLWRNEKLFRLFTFSVLIAQVVMNICYLLIPATLVRPDLQGSDIFTVLLRDVVWVIDQPLNTFPSNHVALSVLAIVVLAMLPQGLKRFWLLQLWLALVAVSTLLTHQHVISDLISGVILGAAVPLLLARFSAWRGV